VARDAREDVVVIERDIKPICHPIHYTSIHMHNESHVFIVCVSRDGILTCVAVV